MIEEYVYANTPQAKYDRTHTTFVSLRLDLSKDSDIFDAIDGKAVQTEIKRLVRLALNKTK